MKKLINWLKSKLDHPRPKYPFVLTRCDEQKYVVDLKK
jgi:hypothetical protein